MTLTLGQLQDTLATVLDLVEREGSFDYRLVGTAADLLRGAPIEAADVDFLVRTRAEIDIFARALAGFRCLTPPTWLECGGQYYAAYEVDGVEVDASTVETPTESAFIEARGDGPWTHFVEIDVGERSIKAVAPELRLATELVRDRQDRAETIARWLRDHGCDTALLNNALDAQDIGEDARAPVMAIIGG
ncbi:hypothetical protein [Pleomorphomonas sp. NRK KF1]|uniref:hypothetical protein n=1 Tax=Pleomorphomonas sp. NRK KF1 TaxID=2943000 RepID=UPI0020442250|nr:hypothetical protein [Pleomorphomonas sp. NRK KF1]MCM5554179.1 hypothetical protein [Pleomorphomonas sp. NRK KF1]